MATRPKSPLRATTRSGTEFGVKTMPKDQQRIAMLARWYCLSPEHVARAEIDHRLWRPDLVALQPGETMTREYRSAIRSVKQRFWKLSSVEENAGNHTGPLVGSALVGDGLVAWYATRYGISAASLPWRFRSGINPQFAAHAWMAADIGMQVESLGFRVLSERELSIKTDRNGEEVETQIESPYVNSQGNSVLKKPDVAVISKDARTFIAVEVEKDQNRPIATYMEKMKAYERNGACRAVWYMCGSDTTANRVATAAERVFGNRNYPLRIYTVPGTDGWMGLPGLEQNEGLVNDLRSLL